MEANWAVGNDDFDWTYTETDTTYEGSVKSLRVANGKVFANVGTTSSIIQLDETTGSVDWSHGPISSEFQVNDIVVD